MVRASVNLMVAAVVITLGTAQKLPLSTTYVTFMVVMGTSLADRAWNRESAVYRVSGVFAVVGGWFFTALSAMTITAVFGVIVYNFQFVGIGIVMALVVLGIWTVNKFTGSDDATSLDLGLPDDWRTLPTDEVKTMLHDRVRKISTDYTRLVRGLVTAILAEDSKAIRILMKQITEEEETSRASQALVADQLRTLDMERIASGKAILEFFVRRRELIGEIKAAADAAATHVLNMHMPLDETQAEYLRQFAKLVETYDHALQPNGKDRIPELEGHLNAINEHVDQAVYHQVVGISRDQYGTKNSQLFLGTFTGHLNAANVIHRMHVKTFVKKKDKNPTT